MPLPRPSERTSVRLERMPVLCTPGQFADVTQLWPDSDKPSISTIRRWCRTGLIVTVNRFGREYIDVHATLIKNKLAIGSY